MVRRFVVIAALASLPACGSSPARPTDGGGDGASARAWVSALFVEGASARWKVHEERHEVTPAAAERGGPTSDADWSVTPRDGEMSCKVSAVHSVGELEVSKVECQGFEPNGLLAPPSGVWVAAPAGVYHIYGDPDDTDLRAMIAADDVPLLPQPVVAGTRQNDDHEVVIAAHGYSLCATDTLLMGDDGGTSSCFQRGAWPTTFEWRGAAPPGPTRA
ncbi:MAG: hypothetical protein U1F43_21820 [Myxococcota bacterium]